LDLICGAILERFAAGEERKQGEKYTHKFGRYPISRSRNPKTLCWVVLSDTKGPRREF
jgi:hypothetical protein